MSEDVFTGPFHDKVKSINKANENLSKAVSRYFQIARLYETHREQTTLQGHPLLTKQRQRSQKGFFFIAQLGYKKNILLQIKVFSSWFDI